MKPQERGKWGGRCLSESIVEGERIARVRCGEALREVHLVDVARGDIVQRPVDCLQVAAAREVGGETQEPADLGRRWRLDRAKQVAQPVQPLASPAPAGVRIALRIAGGAEVSLC